jgi:hypothetical protein
MSGRLGACLIWANSCDVRIAVAVVILSNDVTVTKC